MINVPLLRKELEFLTANPELHDQSSYMRRHPCGTAGCLAGHTAVATGHDLYYEPGGYAYYTTNGEVIHRVAERELGLSPVEALKLFDARNSIDTLWKLAEAFTGGEITRPTHSQDDESGENTCD